MNEEEWEKRVFTSAETEALMSPSAEWRAQHLWKIYLKKTHRNTKFSDIDEYIGQPFQISV